MRTATTGVRAIGNCFEAAMLEFQRIKMLGGNVDDWRLVHAEVIGQGPIEGIAHAHAFLANVLTEEVVDRSNGRDLRMPYDFYEYLGRLHETQNCYVYRYETAVERMLEAGHYGPWDLETSTGL